MAVAGWLAADPEPLGAALGRRVTAVETFADGQGEPAYYVVYLQPSGFVIVSADDLVEPIVGFADDGTYEPSAENPLGALVTGDLNGRIAAARGTFSPMAVTVQPAVTETQKKWSFLAGIADASEGGFAPMGLLSISDVRVPPLIASRWGQTSVAGRYCFNYYTPNHYPCGCVATALAQLMRYHQWPSSRTGIGVRQFQIIVDDAFQQASTRGGDGNGGPYRWPLMLDAPNAGATAEQLEAIGAICYDAGIASEMEYTAQGSGTTLPQAGTALLDTFLFANAIEAWNRNENIGRGLDGIVNPNLDADSPVMLGISSGQNGHAVICDGYGYNAATLYHHLNMGWLGTEDAWYNLPAINSNPSFDVIHGCLYNIFTSGSGEIISGRVTDRSGNPISEAAVEAEGDGGPFSAVTDSKGIYALVRVKPYSRYTIRVTASGYRFSPKTVNMGKSDNDSNSSGNEWGVDLVGLEPCLYDSLEDFETGGFEKFQWTRSGESRWTVTSAAQSSGTYSARAGSINDGESMALHLTCECAAGNVTFFRKVSSEQGGDRLTFAIDGVTRREWSGEQDWAEVSFPVTAGTREFEWAYSKDASTSNGGDSAWIDDIAFPMECSECRLDPPVLYAEPSVTQGAINAISWAPVPGATSYYAECARDAGFLNVAADSGWIAGTAYTFAGLQSGGTYWYRVKCRPDETWSQTSQSDFQGDTLNDTTVTGEGDVVLAGGTTQTQAIANPSCETALTTRATWTTLQNSTTIYPKRSLDWAADGTWSFGIVSVKGYHNYGDYGCFRQTVSWTGVDTLVFDYCTMRAGPLMAKILIGGREVWSAQATGADPDARFNVSIDVSNLTGSQVLELKAEGARAGTYDGGVYFDNLRTYSQAQYPAAGRVVSTAINLPEGCSWDTVTFHATAPAGTQVTLDVLPAAGSTPIAGCEGIRSAAGLSGITESTIRLRANLLTGNPAATPVLHDWSVVYAKPACESDWSSAESSTQALSGKTGAQGY